MATRDIEVAPLARLWQLGRGMLDVDEVIEELLQEWPEGFRNKHLAAALGVSRSRAGQVLASRVLSGELDWADEGRRRYIRGIDHGKSGLGFARGAIHAGFWRELVASCPNVAYLALTTLGLTDLRTRQQVRAAVRGLGEHRPDFLVVDFEGVRSISRSAAKELFDEVPHRGLYLEGINMEAPLARVVSRVIGFEERRGYRLPSLSRRGFGPTSHRGHPLPSDDDHDPG